ncbi:MAG: hypothetical protein IJ877_00395 [Candidatus Gastranaerophilales bacterium]|nr:hypothetical protein [Candidatus Gastranaerophilales bacterium]
MRFVLNRIFKNIPILNSFYKAFLNYIDKKYYDKNCKNYRIIPLGLYCMPRIITTLNRLKPSKKYGEKTCPFDLAFFRDADYNIKLIDTHFKSLFDDIFFYKEINAWTNNEGTIVFMHEAGLSLEELKAKYKKRIDNFYEYLNDKTRKIFFLIANQTPITNEQIEKLNTVINKYRDKKDYSIIVINQSKEKLQKTSENIYILDYTQDSLFEEFNKQGNWVLELKKQKLKSAKEFYKKLTNQLEEIIT